MADNRTVVPKYAHYYFRNYISNKQGEPILYQTTIRHANSGDRLYVYLAKDEAPDYYEYFQKDKEKRKQP